MSQSRGGRGGRGRGGPPRGGAPPMTPSYSGSSTTSSRGGFQPRGRGGPPGGGGGGGGYQGGGAPRGGYQGGGGRGGPGGGGSRGGPPEIFAANVPARPDPRLADVDSLVQSFKKLQVGPEMPLRPGFGTKGKPTNARANFFAMTIPKKLVIYVYDVDISPKKDVSGPRKARIFDLLESSPECAPHLGYIAHDRSQRIVAIKQLPQPFTSTIQFFEEGASGPREGSPTYEVEVKFSAALQASDAEPFLQGKDRDYRERDLPSYNFALNLILQSYASKHGVRMGSREDKKIGNSKYFFPSLERHFLSPGLEACRGFFVSVRPTYKQFMVNINVAMAAFYIEGNLADRMQEFLRDTGTLPKEFFDRLRVVTTHLGYPRRRSIHCVMSTTARKTTFPCEELGGTVTVEQFFKRKYNITLRHADDLPVIDVGGPDPKTRKHRTNFLPAEICQIPPNQSYGFGLSEVATANMIKVACNPPAFNANLIVNNGFSLLGLDGRNDILKNAGITVSREMTVVQERQLPPPRVMYRSGTANIRDASWNTLNDKFQVGANFRNWAVLLVQTGGRDEFQGKDDPQLEAFLAAWRDKCRKMGMTVESPPTRIVVKLLPLHQDSNRKRGLADIDREIKNNLNPSAKPSFILVLLSGIDRFIRPGIKRNCDMILGLHTVTMLLGKARKQNGQDQYFANVALKVNIKLGGTNHLLDPQSMQWLTSKKTMLVGMDVTHPSPGTIKGTPSIAAVVASVDDRFVRFPVEFQPQRNQKIEKDAEEMISGLEDIIIHRLQLYEKNSKVLPERIMVFRDGVSEGQYNLVLKRELPQLLDAFKKLKQGKYRPTISIIICTKRHHTRDYPVSLQDASTNGNTMAGTVFDSGITDPYNFDFYLGPHKCLQGQTRKTHYTVIYDENKLDADMIQGGTHSFSYLYARATKAVSLIPPAYYADLACERAREYLNTFMTGIGASDDRSASSRNTDKERESRERVFQQAMQAWGNGIHKDLKESMFYI